MKAEWKNIIHSTWLKIVLVAIIAIPMIYSGVFLGSMWDPYGNADQIPVAVVNKDQQVDYQGKTLAIGDTLVANLMDTQSMDFQSIDKVKAMQGLQDGKYYMVITIPENFSKNATTLLNEKPEQMQLQYTTNPGSNYIASKMDDSAMQKIKEQVSATVTKTYADTIFSSVQALSDGMRDASLGSEELLDGIEHAQSGSATMTANLQKLASSSLTFQNGADTLIQGLSAYTTGVAGVDEGAQQLAQGIATLQGGTAALSSGTGQLQTGSNSLETGITAYTNGVHTLRESSQLLASSNPALLTGIKQLASGTTNLNMASQRMLSGMQTMSDKLGSAIQDQAQSIAGLQTGNQQAMQQLQELAKQADTVKVLVENIQNQNQRTVAALKTVKASDPASEQTLQAVIAGYETTDYSALLSVLDGLGDQSVTLQQLIDGDSSMIDGLSTGLQQIKSTLDTTGATPETMGLLQGMSTLQQGLQQLDSSVNGTQGLAKSVQAYANGVSALSQGAVQLDGNSSSLTSGAQQLSTGINTIGQKVPSLLQGVDQLSAGGAALSQGTKTLTGNSNALLQGASALSQGSSQISDGAGQLASGSSTLDQGLSRLTAGSSVLRSSLQSGAEQSAISVSEQTKEMLASPVELQHEEISQVDNNGHAMAPYMMSVGLYVACMAFTLMYPLIKNHENAKTGIRMWLGKASVMYVISTSMAVVMVTALMSINGMAPQQAAKTFGMAILISAAFMSMIVFFNITCGKIGAFLMLIFMVFQLGGAAGTYPIETSSSFYNAIHPWMPFSYSVDAFRHTLATNGAIMNDAVVFIAMILLFSMLSILFYHWKVSISEERYEKTLLSKFQ